MTVSTSADFKDSPCLQRVSIEPSRVDGAHVVIRADGTDVLVTIDEFDLIAAEVAAYRRLVREDQKEVA